MSEELSLDAVGADYPSLVREALSVESGELNCSASLCANGHVWLAVGRKLFVWKLIEGNGTSNAPFLLSLPPSGLPYTVRTIRVYCRSKSTVPGVIAVSPEGTIRHWPNITRGYTDSSVDLEREVALSLDEVPGSEEKQMVLSTTTCSFFLLTLEGSTSVPTPGKRQKMNSGVIAKPLYTNAKRGFGKRVSSVLFGDTAKHGSRLLKTTLIDVGGEINDGERLTTDGSDWETSLERTCIVALKTKNIQLYSIEPPSKLCNFDPTQQAAEHFASQIWTCIVALKTKNIQLYSIEPPSKLCNFDPTQQAAEHFASQIWNLRDVPEGSKWRQEINVWLVDCVRARQGVVVLMAACNRAISTQIHLALGYLPIHGPEDACESFEWFSVLKLASGETFRSTDEDSLMDISLQLPEESQQCSHERMEGLMLVTRLYAHSVRLPDLLQGSTDVGMVHCTPFVDDALIGSGSLVVCGDLRRPGIVEGDGVQLICEQNLIHVGRTLSVSR